MQAETIPTAASDHARVAGSAFVSDLTAEATTLVCGPACPLAPVRAGTCCRKMMAAMPSVKPSMTGQGMNDTALPSRRDYSELPRSWRHDVLAGVTVGVVALPLALAFGISSGIGAAAGLITAVIAGLVAAVFGGSHVQVSGPTGAMAVVLAPIVVLHGVGSVALVTVLGGLIVLAAGVTGLGRAVTFIPWPVIEGFTLGIAAIIFLQQLSLIHI